MNFNEYLTISEQTEKKFPEGLNVNTFLTEVLHHVLGVSGEWFELQTAIQNNDTVNTKEEIGDAFWYIAGLFRLCDIDPDTPVRGNVDDSIIGDLLDTIKRSLIYKDGTEIDHNSLHNAICDCHSLFSYYAERCGFTVEECLETNINKLVGKGLVKGRYTGGYSDEAAMNRDLDSERKILEG